MFINIKKIWIQDPAFKGDSIYIEIGVNRVAALLLNVDLARLDIRFENSKEAQVINLDRVLSYTYERLV